MIVFTTPTHGWMKKMMMNTGEFLCGTPIIVIKEGLYVYSEETNELHECKHGCLELNTHCNGTPDALLVHFVTEDHLVDFMKNEVVKDMKIKEMIEQKKENK